MRIFLLLFIIGIIIPELVSAQAPFVPCGNDGQPECSACHLAVMGNNILNWLIGFMFVIFAAIMAVAGFGLVTSGGNPSAKEAAKSKFVNAIVGLIVVLAAWILVDTIMRGVLAGTDGRIAGWGPWSQISCQSQAETRVVERAPEDAQSVAATNPGSATMVDNSLLNESCNPNTLNFPGCAEVTISTNDNMNPLLDCGHGDCSHMVRDGASEHMAETLAGPYAEMVRIFGSDVVINDGIAKDGTSRETETPGSRHFHGDALDLSTAGMSDAQKIQLYQAARSAGFTGFGFGNNILHVDTRSNRAAWTYKNVTSYGGRNVNDMISAAKSN